MNTAVSTVSALNHPIVPAEQWLAERKKLLAREKELTRLQDEIARERRALPWVRVDKNYIFETRDGKRKLADLFEGRRQLLVQHFMLGPDWEQGCQSCSYMADHTDGMNVHLTQRDITFVAISRAPLVNIERFRQRMCWKFNWVSSYGSNFNFDYCVSFTPEQLAKDEVYYNFSKMSFPHNEAPGVSAFYKDDEGNVYHTYSTFGRGVEVMMGAYRMMDLAPKGRDEDDLPFTMHWVRHHDSYEPQPSTKTATAESCCQASA